MTRLDRINSDSIVAPAVDLHVHLRGTVQPEHAAALARASGADECLLHISSNGFVYSGFEGFLRAYDAVGSLFVAPSTLAALVASYLQRCAAEGVDYVEFMLSPRDSFATPSGFHEVLEHIQSAVESARAAYGVDAGLIVTCVRHHGPEAALRTAELVAEVSHPAIVGFGLTGDERRFDITDFRPAFSIANDCGLACTAHVGEWLEARTVVEAVDELGLKRVGHGIRAAEDAAIVRDLAARGIVFEVCLSSNHILGAASADSTHLVLRLLDGGCAITFGTDDPSYFKTSPSQEFNLASKSIGLSGSDLVKIVEFGRQACFRPSQMRAYCQGNTGCETQARDDSVERF